MSLKKQYESYFKIGVALSKKNILTKEHKELTCREFNSITCENDMKPMYLLDWEKNLKTPEKYDLEPACCFEHIRPYLDFAKENNIVMRGHTLVWHNQTPLWFFHEGYDEKAPFASREVILKRLESYICSVLSFTQTEYPGLFYAWDVVNEIVDEGDFRKSLWLDLVGKDFFIKAFEYARKYAAKDTLLFYNDYNSFEPWKRDFICQNVLVPLLEKKLIDGMGMQSHLTMDYPVSLDLFKTAVKTYGKLGLVIHLTELDIHNNDPSDTSMDALADRYEELFQILLDAKRNHTANIGCVTFWNLRDNDSWLTGFRKETSYPLLFTESCEPKAAYHKILHTVNR